MGYEYVLIAAAILVPLGIFSIFKGDPAATSAIAVKKASLPGAFGDSSSTSKSRKKKPKKKTKGTTTTQADLDERRQESSESEIDEKPAAQPPKRNDGKKGSTAPLSATNNVNNNKNTRSSSSAKATESSLTSSPAASGSNLSNVTHTTIGSDNVTSNKPKAASVENWKKQRQEQQREILAKQQEPLQFASAAAKNSSASASSPHISSIPGPGAMGNNKKKNRSNAGSGLSHAEFPTLSRPEPVAPVPKQPKQPKKAKEVVKKPDPIPEPTPASESSEEDHDNEEEEESEQEEQVEEDVSRDVKDTNDDQDEEWTTVNTQSRSGGIDFSKPMDPWVAQQQRQKQERIAAADPHGEQQAQFARVLSIKPTVKEDRIREAIPDGFSVQKSRTGGSSGGSSSYQSAEISKKQRENLAKAAKKKEEKAAMDAMQEKRRQEHMRQVKAEKMKEFYRSQTKKQAPYVESRWDVPKNTAPSSSAVSGGMSSQVNEKGQLIWD